MAAAQNVAMSSTTPTLVQGALATAANSMSNCSNVKGLFETQGINNDIPTQPITGKFFQFISFDFFSAFAFASNSFLYF